MPLFPSEISKFYRARFPPRINTAIEGGYAFKINPVIDNPSIKTDPIKRTKTYGIIEQIATAIGAQSTAIPPGEIWHLYGVYWHGRISDGCNLHIRVRDSVTGIVKWSAFQIEQVTSSHNWDGWITINPPVICQFPDVIEKVIEVNAANIVTVTYNFWKE